jgi:hypothetical protein
MSGECEGVTLPASKKKLPPVSSQGKSNDGFQRYLNRLVAGLFVGHYSDPMPLLLLAITGLRLLRFEVYRMDFVAMLPATRVLVCAEPAYRFFVDAILGRVGHELAATSSSYASIPFLGFTTTSAWGTKRSSEGGLEMSSPVVPPTEALRGAKR